MSGLEFAYGSKKVLHNINFELEDTDFVSVLGPNGVGKTTLLKCVCRIHKPSAGMIKVGEKEVSNISSRELAKEISYVPQRSYASLTTVFDSILIGRKPHIIWTIGKKDIDLVWKIIKLFHMEDYALKYTDEISGGELQKVQIARAVAQDAHVMVLDEPTNNLDLANQHNIMYLLSQLVEKKHICVFMTMHDLNIALRYSTKFIFVKDGKIVAFGGREVVTPEIIEIVYNIDVDIVEHDGVPTVIPKAMQGSFEDIRLDDMLLDFENEESE